MLSTKEEENLLGNMRQCATGWDVIWQLTQDTKLSLKWPYDQLSYDIRDTHVLRSLFHLSIVLNCYCGWSTAEHKGHPIKK